MVDCVRLFGPPILATLLDGGYDAVAGRAHAIPSLIVTGYLEYYRKLARSKEA